MEKEKSEKAKLMFFASCPQCKKKFGIEPRYIMLYLARIIKRYKERYGRVSQMLEAAQADIKQGTS